MSHCPFPKIILMRGLMTFAMIPIVGFAFLAGLFRCDGADESERPLDLNLLVKDVRGAASRWQADAVLASVEVTLCSDGALTAGSLERKKSFVRVVFFSHGARQTRDYVLHLDQTWFGYPPQSFKGKRIAIPEDVDLDVSALIAKSVEAGDRPANSPHVYLRAGLSGDSNALKGIERFCWLAQWFETEPDPKAARPALMLGAVRRPAATESSGPARTWQAGSLTVTEASLGEHPVSRDELKTVRFSSDLSAVGSIMGGRVAEGWVEKAEETSPHLVRNGVAGRPFTKIDRLESPVFNRKGGHMASVGYAMGQAVVVVDGDERPIGRGHQPGMVEYVQWVSFSPQGDRIAYVFTRHDEKTRTSTLQTFVDHEPIGAPVVIVRPENTDGNGRGAGVGRLLFSQDGRRLAYIIDREGEDDVVINGVSGPGFHDIDWESVQFTPDGRDILYVARNDEAYFLVRNGDAGRRFEIKPTIAAVSFDGRRVALRVGGPSSESLFIEGADSMWESDRFAKIDGIRFSPDGKRFAARVQLEEKSMAGLVDGRIGPRYDEIGLPVFTADSAHILHSVQLNGTGRVSIDGRLNEATYAIIDELVVSPVGNRMAFRTKGQDGQAEVLFVNGAESFRGTEIRNLVFSPNGEILACVARGKSGPNVIVNGVRIEDRSAIQGKLYFDDNSILRFVTLHDDQFWRVDVRVDTK